MTKLADLTPRELADSIGREAAGLDAHLALALPQHGNRNDERGLITRAYLGSIMGRAAVLADKLKESE